MDNTDDKSKVDIREIVLRYLYENNSGQLIDIVKILEPFDNDATRKQVNELLNNLDNVDKYIFIDKEYRRMIGRNAGKYKPISQCKIKARLSPDGERYFKATYMKDDKPTVKIEVKDGGQIGNLNTGDIGGDFNQSFKNESTNTLTNPTTPLTTKDSPTTNITTAIIKTISLRTKEILIGIVISVIAALIVWKITGQV